MKRLGTIAFTALITTMVFMGGVIVTAENIARIDGVVVIADSQHRDRWGVDGYHPEYVRDGNADGTGDGARTTSWASDNWEVTHTLAMIFPRRVTVESVVVHWAQARGATLTPRQFQLRGYRDGEWRDLAVVKRELPEGVTRLSLDTAAVGAISLVQPRDGASLAADRRLWIAEVEIMGSPIEPSVTVETDKLRLKFEARLRSLRQEEDTERVAPVIAVAMQGRKRRGLMSIIDRDDIERGRKNVATRPWAKNLADKIRRDADWWLARTDDCIYGLVPEANPRAICPNFEKGCPIHGGARRTFTATLESPYAWKCSKGGEVWRDGAVVKNPKTGEPVVVSDDGDGWLAPEGFLNPGRRYYFVAAYRYFLIGKLFSSPYEPDGGSEYRGGTPVVQLALAYAITGDRKYAHKCAVMLNRLAELYRTYDGCVEGPSQRQDGYIGQTFERFLVQNLILACDLIWDEVEKDTDLHHFFAAKGDVDYDGDGEASAADFSYNLQRNLLGYIYEYLHRMMPYMDGDFLMYEMTALAALAHCLGNADIAAEAMESDLGLRTLLTNSWFRDGKFIYDSCGYNVGNAKTPLLIAEWLHGFKAPARYPEPLDLYHHPEYRMSMLFDFLRYIDCDGRVPQIGDSGGARTKQLRLRPPYDQYDERALLRLPEHRDFYLSRLLAASGGDLETYRRGKSDWWLLFHAAPLDADVLATGPPTITRKPAGGAPACRSHLFDDSGIAILRAGGDPETRQHVCLTFSKGAYGHGHTDKLAINVFRYGYDLTADLGYPTTWTDIKYGGWETNTASHCTAMLDKHTQRGNVTGELHYFATQRMCDVVEASAEGAYPSATLYRRTLALVRDDDGEPLYTVDVFRVAGAKTRDYLFHSIGRPEDLTVKLEDANATWVTQSKGTLAGEDVAPMTRGGYGFLFDVRRAKTDGALTATWRPSTGQSQPDRYLLTKEKFKKFRVEFTIVRTGKASGQRERALFAFCVNTNNVGDRRVAWIDAGGQLPVAQPVRVRIEVDGAKARVFFDGKLRRRGVDVAGDPADNGAVGFLHYYNYAYEYRDIVLTPKDGDAIRVDLTKPLDSAFWGTVDPTYRAADGCLHASDYEAVAMRLHVLGAPGREVIRAKAEGHGVRGQSPLEGHIIVRDRAPDNSQGTAFVAVIEATRAEPRVTDVAALSVTQTGSDPLSGCDGVALRVTTTARSLATSATDELVKKRTDYIVSAMDDTADRTVETGVGRIQFQGRFGFVAARDGKADYLALVGGGHLRCAGRQLELPGSVQGEVINTAPESDSLVVRLDEVSARPSDTLVGQKILVTSPGFICPAVYTIRGVEQADAAWRFKLNMPLGVARGVIKSVDIDNGSFATRTPVMKLRVNPGLFNGKSVRSASGNLAYRLKTATEAAFVLEDRAGIADFRAGEEYVVYDVGVGDRIEVVLQKDSRE